MSNLIIKYGLNIEKSRLTEKQKQDLKSDEYFSSAARAIGTGKNGIIQAGVKLDHDTEEEALAAG